MIWIDVKLTAPERMPERKTAGSVGYDLVAAEDVWIQPGKVGKVGTGVHLSLPHGVEAQTRPRSGLSLKGVIGIVGTIDSDYRGEVSVLLYNTDRSDPFRVQAGDRVGQLVFAAVLLPVLKAKDSLDPTDRGDGGFGSTGK